MVLFDYNHLRAINSWLNSVISFALSGNRWCLYIRHNGKNRPWRDREIWRSTPPKPCCLPYRYPRSNGCFRIAPMPDSTSACYSRSSLSGNRMVLLRWSKFHPSLAGSDRKGNPWILRKPDNCPVVDVWQAGTRWCLFCRSSPWNRDCVPHNRLNRFERQWQSSVFRTSRSEFLCNIFSRCPNQFVWNEDKTGEPRFSMAAPLHSWFFQSYLNGSYYRDNLEHRLWSGWIGLSSFPGPCLPLIRRWLWIGSR